MSRRFKIKLTKPFKKTGMTAYAIAKEIDVAENTIRKYVNEEIVVDYIPMTVVRIAEYLGVDWRDSKVIEVIEEKGGESPKKKAPLAAAS